MRQALLLTGAPGTGKTTLIRQAVSEVPRRLGGFYTQEIRTRGVRQGFEIVTLGGTKAVLAHTSISSSCRVGKYGVDVDALDRVGVQSILHAVADDAIVVADEIGKMELFSAAFRAAIVLTLDSGNRLLGTVMLRTHPWADTIKADPRVQILTVTHSNHDQLLEETRRWLLQ